MKKLNGTFLHYYEKKSIEWVGAKEKRSSEPVGFFCLLGSFSERATERIRGAFFVLLRMPWADRHWRITLILIDTLGRKNKRRRWMDGWMGLTTPFS